MTPSFASSYDDLEPFISPDLVAPGSVLEETERHRMASVSSEIFSSLTTDFDIIDVYPPESGRTFTVRNCDERNALDNITSDVDGARIRIISIPGVATVSPLRISFDLACKMMVHYQVEPQFRDILHSFGHPPSSSGEGGCSNVFVKTDHHCTVGYGLQFVEEHGRGRGTPWSHRHVGVYHQACRAKDDGQEPFDLFILAYSSPDTKFRLHVESLLDEDEAGEALRRRLCRDPGYIHEMAMESYVNDWRWYLRYWGDRFDKKYNMAIVNPRLHPEWLEFEHIYQLRFIRNELTVAQSFCRGNLDILNSLEKLNKSIEPQSSIITVRQKIQGHMVALSSLRERIGESIALIEYALSLKNEATNASINDSMLRLARSSVDDSTSVTVITYLSLVFLPGTFISGIYGMNFFMFDADDRSFVITPMFWIYVVTWLPLTLAVLLLYWKINQRRLQKKRRDHTDHAGRPPAASGQQQQESGNDDRRAGWRGGAITQLYVKVFQDQGHGSKVRDPEKGILTLK